MTWETLLLVGALGAFAAALGLEIMPTRDEPRRERAVRGGFLTGVGLLVFSLLVLISYFLTSHLTTEYVFAYSRSDYPWHYRLAGLWGGQKGTLLMWAAFTGAFGALALRKGDTAIRTGSLPIEAQRSLRAARFFLLILLSLFTLSTLVAKTFAATPDYFLQFSPSGNGLQPVLLTPFMVIHPPLQFVAYALSTVIFCAAAGHVATGDPHWARIIRPWARLGWLIATVGLGLGGLWAYYVLNFGGFWAWDPVETANLLSWFPLTLLLHTLLRYDGGHYRTAAPFFALLTFPMALFATVATRTGLWVSVHAFTDPSKNFARDPLVRLLNILDTSELLRYLTSFLLASLLLAAAAVLWGRTRHLRADRRGPARAFVAAPTLFAGLWLFLDPIGLLGVAFQGAHGLTLGRSAAIGLLLLGFAAAAGLLLTGPETEPAPAPRRDRPSDWTRWITQRYLLATGIMLLSLSFLVVLTIDIIQVNGFDRRIYDERGPWIALPIFATLSTVFLQPLLGARRAAYAAAAAAFAGVALSLMMPNHWAILLVAPALLLAAGASLARVLSTTAAGNRPPWNDNAASIALVIGALLGFFSWANPPTHLDLGFVVLRPEWTWTVPAYALAGLALFAGGLHRARSAPSAARVGALALLPLVGPFGTVTAAGLVALVFLRRSGRSHETLRRAFELKRTNLHKATTYLLHVGLTLGLLGYAAATYESEASDPFSADGSGSPAFHGYSFQVLGGSGVGRDPVQGLPEEIHAQVLVLKDGRALETATLVYWLVPDDTRGHYDARVTVVRRAGEDLYLFPSALHTDEGTFTDHINGAAPSDPTTERVDLTVKVLPGMGLVWGGLWLLAVSMAANLATGGFRIGTAAPAATPRAAAAETVPARIEPTPIESSGRL